MSYLADDGKEVERSVVMYPAEYCHHSLSYSTEWTLTSVISSNKVMQLLLSTFCAGS
jgi:hypothetical protein